jgi:hypothetical protein
MASPTQIKVPPELLKAKLSRLRPRQPRCRMARRRANMKPMCNLPLIPSLPAVVCQQRRLLFSRSHPKSFQSTYLTVPIQNGYHIALRNGFSPMPNGVICHVNGQHNRLSAQQMQNLKSVFANAGQDLNTMHINENRVYTGLMNGAHFNMQLPAGANMNLKLPSSRQHPQSNISRWWAAPRVGIRAQWRCFICMTLFSYCWYSAVHFS